MVENKKHQANKKYLNDLWEATYNHFDEWISEGQWKIALAEVRKYIEDKIQSKSPYKFVSYSELSQVVNSGKSEITLEGEGYNPVLWYLIGEMSRDTTKEYRGMLSAFVVHKNGDKEPGDGFYTFSKELGYDYDDSDEESFWWKQLRHVAAHYGTTL
ncbi:MAG: hypothetical protein MUC35_05440 [Candidatus Margulisbacteria bacterium]|jgi:hypothetical protein|nr:hypothetical protein [Candidatus Margulisiibacteriota bacterium]